MHTAVGAAATNADGLVCVLKHTSVHDVTVVTPKVTMPHHLLGYHLVIMRQAITYPKPVWTTGSMLVEFGWCSSCRNDGDDGFNSLTCHIMGVSCRSSMSIQAL